MHPILFKIGSLTIRSYGVLLISGFLIGLWRGMRLLRRRMVNEPIGSPRRISPDQLFDVSMIGLMLGIVGARVLFVVLNWSQFSSQPINALKIWEGGLSLHGGLLFGILVLVFYCYRHRLSLLALGDVFAPSFAIAYAFGRIGCFLNGCCYGGVCDLPWAMKFHDERYTADQQILTLPSHPTQLYATLFNIGFYFWLSRWEKHKRRDGELFFGYIAMYGAYRGFVDIYRVGGTSSLLPHSPLSATHVVSIIMVIAGFAGIVWLRRKGPAIADAPDKPTIGTTAETAA